MGGRLLDKLFSSIEYHIPYVGEVYKRSMIAVGRSGVALPVPRKRARLQESASRRSDKAAAESDSPRIDHVDDELVTQTPHLERDLDGNQSKQELQSPHPSDGSLESLDILLMLLDQLSGEEVCPELVTFSERDLKIDWPGLVPLFLELVESVSDYQECYRLSTPSDLLVDVAASLNSLVHEWCTVLFLIDWNRERLPTTVPNGVYSVSLPHSSPFRR